MNDLKYSVLIVDDDQSFCMQLKQEIEKYPIFQVGQTLNNGKDAIEYIDTHRPPIIILDLIMPLFDGVYVINFIRREMPGYRPFIYVVSVIGTQQTNQIMRSIKADYYSVKPISPMNVAANLLELMEAAAAESPVPARSRTLPPPQDPTASHTSTQSLPRIDKIVEEFLYNLGAPLYRTSTICTQKVLEICIADTHKIRNLTSLYALVAELVEYGTNAKAVERNVRSCIRAVQSQSNGYYRSVFPKNLSRAPSNSVFISTAVRELLQMAGGHIADSQTAREQRS